MPRKTITVIPSGTITVTSIETESPHSEDDEELKITTATLLTATPQVYEPDSACGVCYDQNDNESKVINCRSTQGWCSTTPRLGGACVSSCADSRCGSGLRAAPVGGINTDDEVFTFNAKSTVNTKSIRLRKPENKCIHGRRPDRCKECGGAGLCEHGRRRNECKECGGASICEHGRQRRLCKECGGADICEHERQRYTYAKNVVVLVFVRTEDSAQDLSNVYLPK